MEQEDKFDRIFDDQPAGGEKTNEPEEIELILDDKAPPSAPTDASNEKTPSAAEPPLPSTAGAVAADPQPVPLTGPAAPDTDPALPTGPDVPQEAQGFTTLPGAGKKKLGCGFFALAAVPFVLLVLLGAALLIAKLTSGQSMSIFTLTKGSPGSPAEAYVAQANREMRGVFVATAYNINYPSRQNLHEQQLKQELDDIIETCLNHQLNAVFFQVSPNSDALYDSDILPISYVLTGKEGTSAPNQFDPLAYLIEKAHARQIQVHAWVNPVRVTTETLTFDQLSADNPAAQHPEWTVEYGSVSYYNLGLPEVRALQASVCAELAGQYEIDGIIFDDYFYPYPIKGESFDDAATFEQYGADFSSVEDFRRSCTTELVKACYEAIKEKNQACRFGIAPFGIWQNDDGVNNGSSTRGFESYESLYCDTLAFIKAGAVDYIAPQLYWQMDFEAAPYRALCDWWNQAVEGTGVQLYISHAAYKAADWKSETEFTEQVEFARKLKNYRGSIFYGLAAIEENDQKIGAQLNAVYHSELLYMDFYSTGQPVELTRQSTQDGIVYVEGTSDVYYPLYYQDRVVSQHKDGSFSLSVNKPEDGMLHFSQNGKEYSFSLE